MSLPASSRFALDNRLNEALGSQVADTLMRYLPDREASDLATGLDIAAVKSDISELRSDVSAVQFDVGGVRSDITVGDRRGPFLSQRIDRLYQAMVAAPIAAGLLN